MRMNVFVTKDELEYVKTEYEVSGMYLSGGIPMGDPQKAVQELNKKYNMPEGAGLDLSSGEFVSP